MSGSKGADVDDQDAADAANQEVLVLDRLVYRNRSQHRNAKYFTLALEVRRACRIFAAPHVPELLVKCLGILSRVPDSRNGRAREAWVRSAAAALQRMSAAAVACAEVLEATAQASKHLAHQVSQTYFMALSVVFLACLARLFVCSLHLGGRLVEVHGALLRTLLAQPSTSECLPAAALAACRIPEETATFLFHLRGAGRSTKLRGGKAPGRAAAAATAAAAASPGEVLDATPVESSMSASIPTVGNTGGKGGAVVEGRGEVGRASGGVVIGADDDGDDSDDTGVRIGRAVAADQVENRPSAGKVFRAEGVATVGQSGKRGTVESDAGRTGGETEGGGRSGGDGRTRNGDRGFKPPRKKVVLASEFSDSSDDESDNSTTKPGQQQQRQPQRSAAAAAAAAAATSPIRAEASRSGSGRASPEEVPSGEHVGWMIDRGPACAATPPRCTNGREDGAAPSSSSSSSSPLAVATAAATSSPQGEDASLRTPGAQRGVTNGVAEGTRDRMNGFPVGVKTSSKEHQSVENGARAADATKDVPKASLTRETAGAEAHVSEGPAISCVAGIEASGGGAGEPPPRLVDFFGSSSAVEATSSCSSATTGETRRRKKGRKGKQQAASKRKRPPSSLPAPSKSTPSAVDSGGGYGRKAAVSSKTGRASEEAVSDCRRSVVRGSRGEGVGGEIMMLAARGDMEKHNLGGIGSPESVSLPPEPALQPGAATVRAAVDAAASTTEALPPAAPSHHKVDEKGSKNVGGSSLPPTKLLQQRGHASTKERSNPTNSGAGSTRDGGVSGAKRSLAGEARGEMTNRKKKKKSKKASKGATKLSAGGKGGDGNAIDDIFGSFS